MTNFGGCSTVSGAQEYPASQHPPLRPPLRSSPLRKSALLDLSEADVCSTVSPSSTPYPHPVPLPPVSPSVNPSQIRVLVAGDHDCLRRSLKTMLELDPRILVVGEAGDDCETIKAARRLRPDVVLIDLDMRCCDKYSALIEITQEGLAASVVALTIHEAADERKAAQAAGVSILLEKGVPYRQLISAIRLAATTAPLS